MFVNNCNNSVNIFNKYSHGYIFIMWEVGFYFVGYAHHLNLDVYVHFIILQLKPRVMQAILAKSEGKII